MEQKHIDWAAVGGNELTKNDRICLCSCPYLGSERDPATLLAYPNDNNRCFRWQSPDKVSLTKQEQLCLTDGHTACHIFQQALIPPEEITNVRSGTGFVRRNLPVRKFALAIMLVLILLTVLVWRMQQRSRAQEDFDFSALSQTNGTSAYGESGESAMFPEETQVERHESVSSAGLAFEEKLAHNLPQERGNRKSQIDEESEATEMEEKISVSARSAKEKGFAANTRLPVPGTEPAPADMQFELSRTTTKTSATDVLNEKLEMESNHAFEVSVSDLPDLFFAFQIPSAGKVPEPGPAKRFEPAPYYSKPTKAVPIILDEQANVLDLLQVRHGPGAKDDLFVEISRQEPVNFLGKDSTGNWLKIRSTSGIEGWITVGDTGAGIWATGLPEINGQGANSLTDSLPTSLLMVNMAVVAHNGLVLRSAPGSNFRPIATINEGEIVGLLGRWRNEPWVRIRLHDGSEGWVNAFSLEPDG